MYTNPTPAGEAYQVNGVWYQEYNVTNEHGAQVKKLFMHNGTEWVEAPQQTGLKIDITKNIPNTPSGINLKKNTINLDKCLIDLTKKSGVSLDRHKSRVAVVIDFSGSMKSLYKNGSVQRVLSRLLPLGLRFDDNGEVDVWIFHGHFKRLIGMNLENFDTYVDDVILTCGEKYGTTSYSPVLWDVLNKYTKEEPSYMPAFVIYITDGSNDDKRATNDVIIESSRQNIFIQFIGLGVTDKFDYLRKLDDLPGRTCDNTGFIPVKDFDKMSDEELYNELLRQYVDWLRVTNRG